MSQNPLAANIGVTPAPGSHYAPAQFDVNGALIISSSSVPSGTPITASSGNLAATAGAATLAAAAAKTTYITGFTVTGSGATAASQILVTVTGVVGGTMTYIMSIPAGVTLAVTPLNVQFNRAIPGSAVNTAIAVNVPSFGAGNTNAAVVATGYQV